MKSLIAILVLASIGCAPDENPTLEGDWYLESTHKPCISVISLHDKSWSFGEICELEDGRVAMALTLGTFTHRTDRLVFDPTESSCHEASKADFAATYHLSDGQLTLAVDEGVLAFERLDDDGQPSNGAVVLGCFDEAGLFTPSPLRNI